GALLKLIRWPNLMIIAATMALIRYMLIAPMLAVNEIELQQGTLSFWLLVASTLFIAAAGNMINDYFDRDADAVNKPEKVVVGKRISEGAVMNIYLAFNVAGLLLAVYPALELDMLNLILVQLVVCGLLWFYSSTFKGTAIVGNLIVATLSGLIPLLAGMYEWMYEAKKLELYWFNFDFIWGYALFAFLLTWVREIVKDMEDYQGDLSAGLSTLPLIAGKGVARGMALILTIVIIICAGVVMKEQYRAADNTSFYYFLFLIQLPLTALFIMITRAKEQREYHRASSWSKWIMVLGLLYTIVIWYSLQ
ncbi:MAG: geranylgeranylglycerol-phosphate geranylgeranyltransferase, partial [Flavobacteriales bacterium]|nr:geranylgeranylglycerol-phosphate geranylgeranyltransferase [Flavobacteriales bacterium]